MRTTRSIIAGANNYTLRVAIVAIATVLSGCVSTMNIPSSSLVSQSEFLSVNANVAFLTPDTNSLCLDRFEKTAEGGDLGWCETYVLNDLVDEFEQSPDEQTATAFLAHAARLKAGYNRIEKDRVRGRIVGGWMSKSYSKGRPHVWAVHTGMLAYPLARFAAVVRRKNIDAYRSEAKDLLAFAKEAYGQMEGDWKDGAYRYPGSGFHREKGYPVPYNMQAAMGLLALNIYQADPSDQSYLTRAKAIGRRIDKASKYRLIGGFGGKRMLAWNYDEVSGAEDTSHAILTMGFITKMYESKLIFTKKRYKAMLATFLDGAIGKGSVVNGNLISEGHGESFKGTCHRALLIYRHHAPTFARCQG